MKTTLLLLLSLAGLSFGQTLPYECTYKNDKGWLEKMAFAEAPNSPGVIWVTIYTYVDTQTPYFKVKKSYVADTKQALAFVAAQQANDHAFREAQSRAAQAAAQQRQAAANAEAQRRRDIDNANRMEDAIADGVERALAKDRLLR